MIDIPAAADRLVIRSGLVQLSNLELRTHRLRWWPLALILAFPIGAAVIWLGATPATQFIGRATGAIAFMAASFMRIAGPLRNPTPATPLDERERALRSKAYAIGFGITAYLACFGLVWMTMAAILPLPRPRDPQDWLYLFFFAQTLILLLPVLAASWALPPAPDDED